ncbi:MAG: type IV pilus assembly protein PilM [Candidatus Marinimicrobia bacterium]|nr:type IV pilus assembly protein PilM [Candidatus Neomarinimicrobiota bacterium]
MILGLDIGRQVVKMVTMEVNKQKIKILDVGERSLFDVNQTYDPDKVSKPYWAMAIKELFSHKGLKPKKIRNLITALNGTHASIKQITTLDMSKDELLSAMIFEARKHIPMDGTDAVVDYQIFGENTKEMDKIDVGLVACTKRTLTAHLDLLKEVGLKPGIVETEVTAITNIFTYTHEMPDEGLYVILNIGALSTSIIVMGRVAEYFTREIPIGSFQMVQDIMKKRKVSHLDAVSILQKDGIESLKTDQDMDSSLSVGVSVADRSIFDNFVEDIRRSLRYYAKSTGQSFFLKIFLTGGASNLPGITEFIQSKLNVDTELFNPFEALDFNDDLDVQNPFQYTVALGLALRGGLHE